ncbi:MAG TPA: hypothetical protein VJX10_22235, partial [Pseudonocardiaceae bacterium]|nr:hypothetical protein [Pseudonocardiaceae bacterium]
MADDELFGADGTQPLPPPPLLPDPLGGLVTGALFSDTTAVVTAVEQAPAAQAATPVEQARRRTVQATATRRPARSAPGATTPTAIPVAESLPSRPKESRRPTRATTPVAVNPAPVWNTPAPNRTTRTVSTSNPS